MSNITPQMQAQLAAAEAKAAQIAAIQQRNKEAARMHLEIIRVMLAQRPSK
jgi:hypothetical protein